LTPKQKLFINALFGEAQGNYRAAMDIAEYSKNTSINDVLKGCEEEIISSSKNFLAANAPKAAMAIVGVIDDPVEMGTRDKLAAAKDVLDRIGVSKTDKVEVKSPQGIFILPRKNDDEDILSDGTNE
tara:strand:+ start:220 stop:600 length:381 start_codon:yes stop_codon:yes gene_type:complete